MDLADAVGSSGEWLTLQTSISSVILGLSVQPTLQIDPPPFARSVFSQELFANGDGVFSRFVWVNAGRVGNCSHGGFYGGVNSDLDNIDIEIYRFPEPRPTRDPSLTQPSPLCSCVNDRFVYLLPHCSPLLPFTPSLLFYPPSILPYAPPLITSFP